MNKNKRWFRKERSAWNKFAGTGTQQSKFFLTGRAAERTIGKKK